MDKSRYVPSLFAVLQGHAPDADSKQLCSRILWAMQEQGLSDEAIQMHLAQAIADGLRSRNWPWNERPLPGGQTVVAPSSPNL